MIILDKPYVSEFLKNTIEQNQIPLIKTNNLNQFILGDKINYISEHHAVEHFRKKPTSRLYTNSENAIDWISENLSFTQIPDKIKVFKDKLLFRELLKAEFPDLYFQGITISDFENIDITSVPKPFIIKPAVGFFSMAVYRINNDSEWPAVKSKILEELKSVEGLYPKQVMDTERFIIESIIEGDEFAVDAYYNSSGEVVILNIMKHIFASGNDFSDRLYITSDEVIRENIQEMELFLKMLGTKAELSNFPVHVEVRKKKGKSSVPIEVNPLRFGAWCTTADATWMAYQYNSIEYYLSDKKPDWEKILESKKDKIYAMMVLENSTGYSSEQIKTFNYNKLLSNLEKPLDLRKIDFRKYPVFGFLFAETRKANFEELEKILLSDLKEFVELNKLS
jgi:hypothetical protein